MVKQLFPVDFLPYYLLQRDRIGSITEKLLLVDIDASANDAILYCASTQGGLYQCSTYFFVTPVNVVRPFDADAACILRQGVSKSHRIGHRQDELMSCGYSGMQ